MNLPSAFPYPSFFIENENDKAVGKYLECGAVVARELRYTDTRYYNEVLATLESLAEAAKPENNTVLFDDGTVN
jgi:hypothetical protein